MTWVLLVIFIKGSALTAVPGYSSLKACKIAGEEAHQSMFNTWSEGNSLHSANTLTWACIHGPRRTDAH